MIIEYTTLKSNMTKIEMLYQLGRYVLSSCTIITKELLITEKNFEFLIKKTIQIPWNMFLA